MKIGLLRYQKKGKAVKKKMKGSEEKIDAGRNGARFLPHFRSGMKLKGKDYFTLVQMFVFPIREMPMKPRTFKVSGFSRVSLHL